MPVPRKTRRIVDSPAYDKEKGSVSEMSDRSSLYRVYQVGSWKACTAVVGPVEAKERLKALWTTLGVVSALMASFTYSVIVNPSIGLRSEPPEDKNLENMGNAYVVLTAISLMFSLTVVIFSVICLSEVEYLAHNDDLRDFIYKFQFLFDVILAIFSVSVLTTLAAVLVACFYFYPRGVAWVITASCFCPVIVSSPFITMLSVFTRARLGRHYVEHERRMAEQAAAAPEVEN